MQCGFAKQTCISGQTWICQESPLPTVGCYTVVAEWFLPLSSARSLERWQLLLHTRILCNMPFSVVGQCLESLNSLYQTHLRPPKNSSSLNSLVPPIYSQRDQSGWYLQQQLGNRKFLPYYVQTPESLMCFECPVLNSSKVLYHTLFFVVHPPYWEAACLLSLHRASRKATFSVVPSWTPPWHTQKKFKGKNHTHTHKFLIPKGFFQPPSCKRVDNTYLSISDCKVKLRDMKAFEKTNRKFRL